MQTLEEKREFLQRAMDEGLEVRVDDRLTAKVLCIGNIDVFLRFDMDVEESYSINHFDYRIVEPHITAEDLCEAIERLDETWERLSANKGDIEEVARLMVDLAKRYRAQCERDQAQNGRGE